MPPKKELKLHIEEIVTVVISDIKIVLLESNSVVNALLAPIDQVDQVRLGLRRVRREERQEPLEHLIAWLHHPNAF